MKLAIPAGRVRLEAILRKPKDAVPRGAAVLCHPHPLYGGTMSNGVVYHAGEAALTAGFAALRFNFRGVGNSTGSFDQGVGEQEDVSSAISWLEATYPDIPLVLIGYSFGAWVGMQVGCNDPRIRGMIGIAPPLDSYNFDYLCTNQKPTLLIVGSEDQFCSEESFARLACRLPDTSRTLTINGADHFLAEHVAQVQDLVAEFFRNLEFD
jgi:uncharacterized protein